MPTGSAYDTDVCAPRWDVVCQVIYCLTITAPTRDEALRMVKDIFDVAHLDELDIEIWECC